MGRWETTGVDPLVSSFHGLIKWISAGSHLPENLSDKRLELILVELKGKGTTK